MDVPEHYQIRREPKAYLPRWALSWSLSYEYGRTGQNLLSQARCRCQPNRRTAPLQWSHHNSLHAATRTRYREEKPLIDKYAPLYHVRPDAPPIVLTTGDRDLELLGRYEENAYFWRMMKVAGHKASEIHEFKGRNQRW